VVRFEDLSFDVPDGWQISAILSAPPTDGKDGFRTNVLFSTDRCRQGEAFATYVDRQLIELARKLKRFSLRRRVSVAVGSVEGVQFVVEWAGTQGPVEQAILMFPRQGQIRTITATALAKRGTEPLRPIIEELLAHLAIDALPTGGVSEPADLPEGSAEPAAKPA
jgi:hypothetical protein